MTALTMLDRSQAPSSATALKALSTANRLAGTPGPGAWAFYLGGAGHNKGHGSTWTNPVLDDLAKAGVHLLPIYVGKQGGLSRSRGASDALDAMRLSHDFGNRLGTLCIDVERHTADVDLKAAAEYVSGWTETLQAQGLRSMAYCSVNLVAQLDAHGSPRPDAVWVPRYVAHGPQAKRDPHVIKGVASTAFAKPGQRAWQYGAEFKDHDSDLKPKPCVLEGINVDVSCIDAEVFGPAVIVLDPPVHTTEVHPAAMRTQPAGGTLTIKPNDTLSQLEAALHLKSGSLFAANQELLDGVARKHGKPDSRHGGLIFPGTVIRLP